LKCQRHFFIVVFTLLILCIPIHSHATESVLEDVVKVNEDHTVTIKNQDGNSVAGYICHTSVGVGDKVELSFAFSQAQPVWMGVSGIQEDGTEKEIGADIRQTDIKGHSFSFVNKWAPCKALRIEVVFLDKTIDWSQNEVTITRLEIIDADTPTVTSSGTITIPNVTKDKQVHYTFEQEAKAGQTLCFDLTVAPFEQNIVFSVLGCDLRVDGWTNELYQEEVELWPKNEKKTVSVELKEDVSIFTIVVQFDENIENDTEVDTAKIRDIHFLDGKSQSQMEDTRTDVPSNKDTQQANRNKVVIWGVSACVLLIGIIVGVICFAIKKSGKEE